MKTRDFLWIALGLLALLPACKSSRNVEKTVHTRTAAPVRSAAARVADDIKLTEPQFTTMTASGVTAELAFGGRAISLPATVKMYTDSVVMVSLTPFMGIEVFTLECYRGYWRLFDKIARVYYEETYEYLYAKMGVRVDFDMIQSMFSARYFSLAGAQPLLRRSKYIPMESGEHVIETSFESVTRRVVADAGFHIAQAAWNEEDGRYGVTADYKEYTSMRGVHFPRAITFELLRGGRSAARVGLKVQKAAFDGSSRLSLNNTDRYRRSTLDRLDAGAVLDQLAK